MANLNERLRGVTGDRIRGEIANVIRRSSDASLFRHEVICNIISHGSSSQICIHQCVDDVSHLVVGYDAVDI